MTVLEKYKTEQFTIGFAAWAHGVLKMKIGNYMQSRQRHHNRNAAHAESIDMIASKESNPSLRRFLIDCLHKLCQFNRIYGRVLNLHHQGFSTEDICRKLDLEANHLYVSLNRGRSLLKACLEEKGVFA
jgi:DNA-directed RNA polymerase specialized sigma24 family protein